MNDDRTKPWNARSAGLGLLVLRRAIPDGNSQKVPSWLILVNPKPLRVDAPWSAKLVKQFEFFAIDKHPKVDVSAAIFGGFNPFASKNASIRVVRGLIDRIVLKPQPEGGKLSLHLEGALAALLFLSTGAKTQKGLSDKTQAVEYIEELVLVAGGRSRRNLPTLCCVI